MSRIEALIVAPVASLFMLVGCATGIPLPPDALLPQMLASAQEGQRVSVVGDLAFGPLARHLWTSDSAKQKQQWASCVTLVDIDALRPDLTRLSGRRVLITGTVQKDVLSGYVDYGACNQIGLSVEAVSAVRK